MTRLLPVTAKAMGYRATEEDGKLTIHRVEIFCACERGGVQFDDAWIKKAVEHAMEQQRGGYLPPLHVRHHEPSTEANNAVRAAGVFKITGTASLTLKGFMRTAVMADLIITDPATKEEILEMRLPYRSVEIFDVDKPAIDGLALLDHEAPFLELPLLMVAQLDEQERDGFTTADTVIPGASPGTVARVANATLCRSWRMERTDDDGPVVACFSHGAGAHLLYRQEKDMAKPEDTVELEEKPTQKNFAEDEKKDDDKDENMESDEGGGLDVGAVVKAIESGEITVADMDAILAAIQAQGGQEEPAEEEPEAVAAPAATPGAVAMKKETSADSVQMAALAGKVEAMEALTRERDSKELREKDVAAAVKRLEGRALGSDHETLWLKVHEEHGPAAFASRIDELAATLGVVPTQTGGAQMVAQDGKQPECVLKFYKQGPDEGERAARLAAKWPELKALGMSVPLERYVESGMKAQA